MKRNGKQQRTNSVVEFKWDTEQQNAFDAIKQAVLGNVNSGGDDNRWYHLFTDALKTGTGGVLCQLKEANTQSRYHATERECLAVVKAFGEVRWTIMGSQYPVMLCNDRQALLQILKSEDITDSISR